MIKQIQLRGISRTPSDRMTSDGGCAESLNVCLDGQETAPVQAPEDVSYSVYGETGNSHIVYIHKMNNVTWYIGYEKGKLTAYGPQDEDNFPAIYVFKEFGESESVENVISMGNTLIVYTNEKPYYFLFKDNTYRFLGNEIPSPKIEIVSRPNFAEGAAGRTWVYENCTVTVDIGSNSRSDYDEVAKRAWEKITTITAQERENGNFFAPFFIRYAVKLYDGSYVNCSVPILCGGSEETWMTLSYDNAVKATLNEIFRVRVRMTEDSFSNWSDLVSSIEFFASQPIYTPEFNSVIEDYGSKGYIFKGMSDKGKDETILDAVLSKSNFYRIASFSIEKQSDMNELTSGDYVIKNSDDIGGEKLATHPELPDSYRDGISRSPLNGVQTYNGRLMFLGCKETLSRGHMFLGGIISKVELEYPRDWPVYPLYLRFKINAAGESKYVFGYYGNAGNDDEKRYLPSVVLGEKGIGGMSARLKFSNDVTESEYGSNLYFPAVPHAWLCYPDSRCTEVLVYDHLGQAVRIPMKPHPLLECSYAFFGFGKSLYTMIDVRYDISDETLIEDNVVVVPNKLFQSEFENPFIFPASGIIAFPDNIIDAATTSVPLSQGQFGQFPLYVFTEGGIRVLSVGETGNLVSNSVLASLSRHIALPGTIHSIEQAIVFATERGVMLLSGGTVSELSVSMNGTPYVVGEDLKALLTSSEWTGLVSAACDNGAFMEFMRKSKVAYDSNGARLLFFSEGKTYAYMYVIPTETWHKVHFPESNITILNSYPECLISTGDGAGAKIWDFSSRLDDSDYLSDVKNAVKGIVITRPFDLEAPDVRKVIKDIRVRGRFNKGDVKYILLGSFDGISWKRLTSLRGGSYKLFRIVLLCNLAPMERLSWIDVDFDTRFNTRLR